MSQKFTIKKSKNKHHYDVLFSSLTFGEILCIQNAIELHAKSGSTVAFDLLLSMKDRVQTANDDRTKNIANDVT